MYHFLSLIGLKLSFHSALSSTNEQIIERSILLGKNDFLERQFWWEFKQDRKERFSPFYYSAQSDIFSFVWKSGFQICLLHNFDTVPSMQFQLVSVIPKWLNDTSNPCKSINSLFSSRCLFKRDLGLKTSKRVFFSNVKYNDN